MTSALAAVLMFTAALSAPPIAPAPDAISALAGPTEGKVVVECLVAPEGSLTDCLVVEETPAGRGLGARALQESAKLKMDAQTVAAMSASGARVRIPFTFKL